MAKTLLARNLRDGQLVISDGSSTPKSLTLTLDEGDLSWTETENTIEIKDRGSLDHARDGDEESVELSFSAKWLQLIQGTVTPADGYALYEMVNNVGDAFTGVAAAGWKYCLKYVFTVTDPAGVATEKATFAKVYKSELVMEEGDESNTISFTGRDFETRPTIARVP